MTINVKLDRVLDGRTLTGCSFVVGREGERFVLFGCAGGTGRRRRGRKTCDVGEQVSEEERRERRSGRAHSCP